jgi:hypothetical protein
MAGSLKQLEMLKELQKLNGPPSNAFFLLTLERSNFLTALT